MSNPNYFTKSKDREKDQKVIINTPLRLGGSLLVGIRSLSPFATKTVHSSRITRPTDNPPLLYEAKTNQATPTKTFFDLFVYIVYCVYRKSQLEVLYVSIILDTLDPELLFSYLSRTMFPHAGQLFPLW